MIIMEWYVFAVLSAAFASLAPIAEKKSLKSLNALEFSTVFAIMNLVITLPILFLFPFNVPLGTMAVLFIGSLFSASGFLSVIKSMKKLPISVVSPLRNFDPAILALLAFVILGEKMTANQISGIAMIILGAYSLEIKKHDLAWPLKVFFNSKKSKFYLFLFLAGVLYGFSSIADKMALSVIKPLQYLLIAHVFLAFNFFALTVATKRSGLKKTGLALKNSMKWVFAAALLTVSYRLLQAVAVSMANVSLVIPIRHLSVLFTTAIGGKLFHEKHLLHRIVSALIMLVGAYMVIAGA